MFYNFRRIHSTLRVSPAMAAGVSDRLWDMSDIRRAYRCARGIAKASNYLSEAGCVSRRPIISRNITADVASIERTIGSILGARYVPNPEIKEYAYVLRFPPSQVITSQHLARVLSKLPTPRGGSVLVAGEFTIEARAVAVEASCEIARRFLD